MKNWGYLCKGCWRRLGVRLLIVKGFFNCIGGDVRNGGRGGFGIGGEEGNRIGWWMIIGEVKVKVGFLFK